ncbi:MAG: copper resistance protein CopC [Cellulomonas sp.]|nr:copper resistance protein CopC [Cellulomonas sp.]
MPRRRLRTLARALPIAALVLVAGLFGPSASAHDELVGTDPGDGTTVDVAPTQVTMTFAEEPLALGTELLVTGPDGAQVQDGAAEVSGTQVVQPLVTDLASGAYRVDWRVTASDGHVASGAFTFTVAEVVAPVASSDPTQSSDPGDGTDDSSEPLLIATAPAPTPSADVSDSSGTSRPLVWVVVVAAVIAVAAAGYVALRRRRS